MVSGEHVKIVRSGWYKDMTILCVCFVVTLTVVLESCQVSVHGVRCQMVSGEHVQIVRSGWYKDMTMSWVRFTGYVQWSPSDNNIQCLVLDSYVLFIL